MGETTFSQRVDALLAANGGRMTAHDLAASLYPDRKSWRYSSNGGPPGCFMPMFMNLRRNGYCVSCGETYSGSRIVRPRPDSSRREEG